MDRSQGFLSLPETAAELGLSELAVRRRVQEGRLPAYRNPADRRRYLIRRSDLAAFLRPEPIRRARGASPAGAAA